MSLSFSKQTAAVLEVVEQIYSPGELSEFPDRIFRALEHLVPGALFSMETLDVRSGVASSAANRTPPQNSAEWRERIMELLPTHPAFPYVAENPHTVIAINDCVSEREFRRSALYNDILKPMDVAHQIVIGLQIPHHVAGVTISRDNDFTDTERQLLRALAPHLALAHVHAQNLTTLRQLESVVSPSVEALSALGLSLREAEVLHWIIQGKRDAEIASILGVSPRTAQKHVQNVLSKLGVETRTAAVLEALQRLRSGCAPER